MKIEAPMPLEGRRLLVAASGSIAAVKTPLLVSALVKAGAEVRCVITPSASRLVSPVALASLSRHPCLQDQDQWEASQPRPLHVELAEWADLVVVAPLSDTSLARWTQGLGDGLGFLALGLRAPCGGGISHEHWNVGQRCGSSQLGSLATGPTGALPWSRARVIGL